MYFSISFNDFHEYFSELVSLKKKNVYLKAQVNKLNMLLLNNALQFASYTFFHEIDYKHQLNDAFM